jgi:cobalt-zinc-cadmium efflux system protein
MSSKHNHNGSSTVINYNNAFAIGIALNVTYIIIEVFYGLLIHSMSLIADAGHNLSDVLGLLLAWGAGYLAKSTSTNKRTYGFRKSTILAAVINGVLLLVVVGGISFEALRKFLHPEPVPGITMMLVASVGVGINGITALLFFKGKDKDLNIKGAFIHMAADAAVSLGVAAGGLVILFTGWMWIDPAVSILILVVITIGTWGLLKDSVLLSMDAVPEHISTDDVRKYLSSLSGVIDVHDLHIWAMSTTEYALTAHLIIPEISSNDNFLCETADVLNHRFGISHTTIQIERAVLTNGTIHNCTAE